MLRVGVRMLCEECGSSQDGSGASFIMAESEQTDGFVADWTGLDWNGMDGGGPGRRDGRVDWLVGWLVERDKVIKE